MKELSNFQLNKAIAEALYPYTTVKKNCDDESIYIIQFPGDYLFLDYCNNWNDLMSEIVKLNGDFDVYQTIVGWGARISYSDQEFGGRGKTQIQALAMAFLESLKALQGEQANE